MSVSLLHRAPHRRQRQPQPRRCWETEERVLPCTGTWGLIRGTEVPILVPLSKSKHPARMGSASPSCRPQGPGLFHQPLRGLNCPNGESCRSSVV